MKLRCFNSLVNMTKVAIGEYLSVDFFFYRATMHNKSDWVRLFPKIFFCFVLQRLNHFILCSCVQIRNWFDYRNHICIVSVLVNFEMPMIFPQLGKRLGLNFFVDGFKWMKQVFEKLGSSLYDFLRKNNYRSFPIDLVREIGWQLLECVACV